MAMQPGESLRAERGMGGQHVETAVERMWHICDSQGQILESA